MSTAALASEVTVLTQTLAPAIVLGSAEPLQATTALTMSGAPAGATVRYYADFAALGSALTVSPFQQSWDTTTASNGTHLLQAMVQLTPDNAIEVRRQVTVGNPSPVPGLQVAMAVTPTISQTAVVVSAVSDVGIASVQLFVDGQSVGTLTVPNVCLQGNACGVPKPPQWAYGFTLSYANYSNGQHAVLGIATDNNGAKSQASTTVVMNDPPHIVLARPADGEIVSTGGLQVNGSVSDDTMFADVTITLGAVQIQHITQGSFNFSYDLTGVANGWYTLTVSAQDQQGAVNVVRHQVLVQAGGAFQPQLVASLGVGNQLVAADGDSALAIADLVLASVSPGTETRSRVLTGSAATGLSTVFLVNSVLTNQSDWRFSARRSMNSAMGDDSGGNFNVYLWDVDGSRRNLSKEAGLTDYAQVYPVINGDWVAWSVGGSSHTHSELMNVVTGQLFSVPAPAGSGLMDEKAVASRGSSPLLCFNVFEPSLTGNDPTAAVFTFDSSTGATQRLSPQGVRDTNVQTDGHRVAWKRLQQGFYSVPFSIVAAHLSQPLVNQVLSDNASQFILRDGLLAWQEQTVTSNVLKTDDGTTTMVVTNKLAATLITAGGGAVAYSLDGKLYLWTPTAGSRLVLDVLPTDIVLTKGWMYFTVGTARALHRVAI